MAVNLCKHFRPAAIVSIAIMGLVGGCNHQRSMSDGATATSFEVSRAHIGKRITIRGQFSSRGKFGPFILLDDQNVVYLVAREPSTWGDNYSAMEGKEVEASGTLKFYHAPDAEPTDGSRARAPDYYYFEVESTRVRLFSP